MRDINPDRKIQYGDQKIDKEHTIADLIYNSFQTGQFFPVSDKTRSGRMGKDNTIEAAWVRNVEQTRKARRWRRRYDTG